MISTLKTLIRYILDAHNAYNGTGMLLALYFVALLIIFFYCKDEKIKKSIVIPSVFFMFVMYVCVPVYNTVKKYLKFYDGRMFWMMITPIITAVGITIFIRNIEDEKKRVLALVLVIPIALFCGEFMISDAMYKRAENDYRLPQSTVEITEHVLSEYKDPVLLVPYTIAHPFRQISTDVKLLFGEDAELGRIIRNKQYKWVSMEMERVTPNLNEIVPFAREEGVDYILFDTVYTELCENGNINIYGYEEDKNYVGDRTSTIDYDDLLNVSVVDDEKGIYWDLSAYDLSYDGTYGQYILYRFD